jgi:hypothetical protein
MIHFPGLNEALSACFNLVKRLRNSFKAQTNNLTGYGLIKAENKISER